MSVCSCVASVRPGANGTVTSSPASFAAFSIAAQPARTMTSASETFFPPDCSLEVLLDAFEHRQHLRQLRGLVDLPVLLRREPDAGAVRAAPLVGPPERGGCRPRGGDQLRDRQARVEDLRLQCGDVGSPISSWSTAGTGSCHSCGSGHPRARATGDGTHVAMQQLVPRPRERVGQLVGMLEETPRDLRRRSDPRAARGRSSASSARAASTGRAHRAPCPRPLLPRLPLVRAGRARGQLPLVPEEVSK